MVEHKTGAHAFVHNVQKFTEKSVLLASSPSVAERDVGGILGCLC